MALIEHEGGIQAALMETINAIVRNTIDLKRAALILRPLSSPRVKMIGEQKANWYHPLLWRGVPSGREAMC
jgi:hypothetical protein